jgi:teichoic acid transport system ATP-binding protein
MAKADKLAPRGDPTVIVDDLHIEYRVQATPPRASSGWGALAARPSWRTVHALRGVAFVAREGETIGVIGRNGSGKSTLMRAIAGLETLASGAVYAAGRPALLGVNAALLPALSGRANVILGALAMGLTMDEARERYNDIVEFSGLGDYIDYPMKTYSSGMQARLKFSIASVRTHQVLLIDEALSVGDRAFKMRSEERIRELRERAGTIFFVSHSMRSIMNTCTRVLWIDAGRVAMDGPPRKVVRAYDDSR